MIGLFIGIIVGVAIMVALVLYGDDLEGW